MIDKLKKYNLKRDFDKTTEPQGSVKNSESGLRFVVQHHIARKDHYDFRLEWKNALMSWAVPKGPSPDSREKRLAVQVEAHPLEYRNFEGVIPKGEYGGGTVMLWDEGFWEPLDDVDKGLQDGALKFLLKGKRLNGKWVLIRLKGDKDKNSSQSVSAVKAKSDSVGSVNWLLIKEKDEFASPDDIGGFTDSVRTGRTMVQIATGNAGNVVKNPFEKTDVQSVKLQNTVPKSGDWLYETKYDGYRIIAYIDSTGVRLVTRNGNDYTGHFSDVAQSLGEFARGRAMVLDGEMVVAGDQGRSDFQALQNYIRHGGRGALIYAIFDILALDGEDLRGKSLVERKETLENLMKNAPGNLFYSVHVEGRGEESFAAACRANLEGIVGKRADSVYSGTRNGDWIKIKCNNRQEFVIGGFSISDKSRGGVSSLLLGVYEASVLTFTGRVGTGFSESGRIELEDKFRRTIIETSPFITAPKKTADEKLFWVRPEFVAEVKFAEWTKENLLRQASFQGLRTDKNPRDITMESSDQKEENGEKIMAKSIAEDNKKLKITNPDKLLFDEPKITKAEVIEYYEKVAERMLPYVTRRLLSVIRCPQGIAGQCFFKKHPGVDSKGVIPAQILNSEGGEETYFYIENAFGLLSEVQMNSLEFHTWGSRAESMESPDMMVFDLDPDEGMSLDAVRRGALDLRSILGELSLSAYLKTSGGKGYHIVVPFVAGATWDTFRDFAKHTAELMERKWPERYTCNVRKVNRKGKTFVDWMRNSRGATSIAPYSIRARKGAAVSMPIAWEELDEVAPDGVKMPDALRRIKGDDPWKDFLKVRTAVRG